MSGKPVEGVQGYSEQAGDLVPLFEALSFEEAHSGITDLIPQRAGALLDIGAGTGRDAAWFAARGWTVEAVEPTPELREAGTRLHASPLITWIDDTLPDLAAVAGKRYDLVWLSAVWMHFLRDERARMMPTIAALVAEGGALMISLRHGPLPEGRRMFEVSADETITHATASGLECVRSIRAPSTVRPGVDWSRLWFTRGSSDG